MKAIFKLYWSQLLVENRLAKAVNQCLKQFQLNQLCAGYSVAYSMHYYLHKGKNNWTLPGTLMDLLV